jgi:hypothetical protein
MTRLPKTQNQTKTNNRIDSVVGGTAPPIDKVNNERRPR